MILRLMGDRQYRIEDACLPRLNELDEKATEAIGAEDLAGMAQQLQAIWDLVRREGTPLPDEELLPSDAIVPPSDLSLAEARSLLTDEGLIPDVPVG
jgi:hypothetical protein